MNEIRRSIQDIIPPARSKPIRVVQKQDAPQTSEGPSSNVPTPPRTPRPPRSSKGGIGGLLVVALVVIVVIGAAFGIVSTLFHRASVSIELNRYAVTVAESYDAAPDGSVLAYTTKTVEEVRTATVPQSGSESVEAVAEGTVTIYNEYSTSPQRLIANTRFETPDGLVYRIKSAVTVPGYKTVSGNKVPGELQVSVFADQPGERYNKPSATFTIPGLKGSPQFESMYARSTSALSGGFVGERAVVDPTVRDTAVNGLTVGIEAAAEAAFVASLKPGELYFPGTLTIELLETPDVSTDSGAQVTLKAVAQAPVFSEDALARVFASEAGVSPEGVLAIENISELAVVVEPLEDGSTLRLTVSGEPRLVGVVDDQKLAQDLAGKNRRSVGGVLSSYPAIADMKISIYPFWRDALPEDISRIVVERVDGVE